MNRWDAARIHHLRFHRPRLVSLITLTTASRTVTHPRGAVATLTTIPTRPAFIGWTTATLLTTGTIIGLITHLVIDDDPHLATFIVTSALLVPWALLASAFERRARSHHRWPHHTGDWVLADVAADPPNQGAGHLLLDDISQLADTHQRMLLLRVRTDNAPAVRLYTRAGFQRTDDQRRTAEMQRRPAAALAAAQRG